MIILPLLKQIWCQWHRLKMFLCKWRSEQQAKRSDCTRLVHSVASFPDAFCSISASSWLWASVLAAAVREFGLPPRAAASCTSMSAMRWFSFSNRTFPSWASRSQCSFSCSSRAIFSWLCITCRRPAGRGEERTVRLWEEDWAEVGRSERATAFRREWGKLYNKPHRYTFYNLIWSKDFEKLHLCANVKDGSDSDPELLIVPRSEGLKSRSPTSSNFIDSFHDFVVVIVTLVLKFNKDSIDQRTQRKTEKGH